MLQEEAILLQNQDRYRLPQYIENPRYGPEFSSGRLGFALQDYSSALF